MEVVMSRAFCYTIRSSTGNHFMDFTWTTLLVKVGTAMAGSFFSLAMLKAQTGHERMVRWLFGIVGGVIFGQWLYKFFYSDLEFIFWEGLVGSIFAMSIVIYFIVSAAAHTFSGAKDLSELIAVFKEARAAIKGDIDKDSRRSSRSRRAPTTPRRGVDDERG
jgi:predicted membrane channel-forming protein YqfA (hemolysin III family)